MKKSVCVFIFLAVFSVFTFAAYDFGKIKSNVSEFTLPNGLKFILVEDHSVPIATFITYVNAGGVDERIGIWGISHFLEHMAFKGTSEIGTNNIKAELKLMSRLDALFDKIKGEKNSLSPNKAKIEKMEKEFAELKEKAATYVVPNEFTNILKINGVVGLNAGTSKDATRYFYSLPSNRLELWAYLESSRFTDPVFREFYKERGVIQEERRMRTENNPVGKLIEELMALAFKDHPYHVNGIGPMSNIDNITRAEMTAYFKTHYTAGNMVVGVTGDVTPEQLKKMANKYFSKIRPGKRNDLLFTIEPPQRGEKTITLYEDSQPWLILGYHIPSERHKDFAKFSILDRILTSGRSSRLNKQMVIKDKLALAVFSMAGFPGSKYPSLYLMGALPNSGHTTDELLENIDKQIESIKKDGISQEELDSAKTRAKVTILRQMQSNQGLIMNLLGAEVILGSWQKAFDQLEQMEKITVGDIQNLVNTYLIKSSRSIARIEKKKEVKK